VPLEPPLLRVLEARGWNSREAPVFIQSFESANLRDLRQRTKVRLVQLVDRRGTLDDAALKTIATYADGLGPEKPHILPIGPDGALLPPTDLVTRAHAAGLVVHAWTVRSDREFLPAGYKGRVEEEFERLRAAGVDGVFTDFPDAAARVYKK
jgi:glycerophosphoryl diester phosphodiesterase